MLRQSPVDTPTMSVDTEHDSARLSGPTTPPPLPCHDEKSGKFESTADWCLQQQKELGFSRDYSGLFDNSSPLEQHSAHVRTQQHSTAHARVWFGLRFRELCRLCVVMPLVGLVLCLVVAVAFQFEHIQETACKVYNVVPSISAVTGISPGRYLWRIVVAFHLGPRLLIVSTYYHFLLSFVGKVGGAGSRKQQQGSSSSRANGAGQGTHANGPAVSSDLADAQRDLEARSLVRLLKAVYYLQIMEIVGLCGISFIHNRENYSIHQKGFILYLSSSHFTFLLTLKIYHVLWPHLDLQQRLSYYKKRRAFLFSFGCLFVMAYFYYRHIVHCDLLAFSIFAFVEYFVAAANMYYYWTVVTDLPDEELVVLRPPRAQPRQLANGHATWVVGEEDLQTLKKEL